MNGGGYMNGPQSKYNSDFYYFSERVMVLKVFKEIHMAKVIFVESAKESIVDISGISTIPIFDVSIPITLLGGGKR